MWNKFEREMPKDYIMILDEILPVMWILSKFELFMVLKIEME